MDDRVRVIRDDRKQEPDIQAAVKIIEDGMKELGKKIREAERELSKRIEIWANGKCFSITVVEPEETFTMTVAKPEETPEEATEEEKYKKPPDKLIPCRICGQKYFDKRSAKDCARSHSWQNMKGRR